MKTELKYFIISLTAVAVVFIGILISFFLFYRKRHMVFQQEKRELTEIFNKEILNAKIEMQEQTVTHFCRELHDNLGQKLSVARIYINKLEASKHHSDEKNELESISGLLGDAINDLRNMVNSINPESVAQFRLPELLQTELERINQMGIARCRLWLNGYEERFDEKQELLLFRICQEFIQNSIKHSHFSELEIQLDFEGDHFIMQLEDNGCGFDLEEGMAKSKGMGLRNILNRIRILGGTLKSGNGKLNGTQFIITLPLKNATNG